MDTNFAAITIFTFLFAVCTARISLDSQPHCKVQDSNLGFGFVPRDTKIPGSNGPENVLESGKDQTIRVDLTPRSDFARFHAINRRFFDESRVPIRPFHTRTHRHFPRPIGTPRSKMSHEKELIKFHRSSRLKFEHDHYHHHHHHHHRDHDHNNYHIHRDNNEVSMPKHKFIREKVVHEHKVETREQEPRFIKSIRKFLKHTFD